MNQATQGPAEKTVEEQHERVGGSQKLTVADLQQALGKNSNFHVERYLDSGAFGVTFLARDIQLKRPVVIKVLKLPRHESAGLSQARCELFMREMQTLASLGKHQGIVEVYQVGTLGTGYWPDGTPFAAMEYCDGGTLQEHIAKQPSKRLLPENAAGVIREAAEALAFVHAKQIVHRDLKPENIFLTQEEGICIGDWGSAKSIQELEVEDGTYGYMSPEQLWDGLVDGRSDIFSLGVIFYEILVAMRPFPEALKLGRNLFRNRDVKFVSIKSLDRNIDSVLADIVERCLEKDPKERFPSAGDLADSIRRWQENRDARNSKPFELFEKTSEFSDRTDSICPSLDDCRKGIVYRPELMPEVIRTLEKERCTVVWGMGAAGKTVLASLIALDPRSPFSRGPAFYLSLQDAGSRELDTAPDAVERLAGHDVLFIVDDVHLNEEVAEELFDAWRATDASGSRLLLLGRLTTPGHDLKGRDSPLQQVREEVTGLTLTATANDLWGVAERLLRRFSDRRSIVKPPHDVLVRWERSFGGDLIAFSYAVRERWRNLIVGDWDLAPAHARKYVHDKYLKTQSQEELEWLLTLAAVGDIELGLHKSITGESLQKAMNLGLAVRSESEHSRLGARIALVHPSFSKLLWSAAGLTDDELPARRKLVAERDRATAWQIAFRLRKLSRQGDRKVASSLEAELAPLTQFLAGQLNDSLTAALNLGTPWLVDTSAFLLQRELVSASEIESWFRAQVDRVLAVALSDQLEQLSKVLEYAQENFSAVSGDLFRRLFDHSRQDALIAQVLSSPLHGLTRLFKLLNKSGVYWSVRQDIKGMLERVLSTSRKDEFLESVLSTSPLHWASFLDSPDVHRLRQTLFSMLQEEGRITAMLSGVYGKAVSNDLLGNTGHDSLRKLVKLLDIAERYPELKHLRDLLTKQLSEPLRFEALLQSCLRMQLNHLASFLRDARRHFPGLHEQLLEGLQNSLQTSTLLESCLKCDVSAIRGFFRGSEDDACEGLRESLLAALRDPNESKRFWTWLARQSIQQLGDLLDFDKSKDPTLDARLNQMLREIVQRITIDFWWQEMGNDSVRHTSKFDKLARAFHTEIGRRDIAETIARKVLTGDFVEPDTGILSLSYLINFGGRLAGEKAVHSNVQRVVTESWWKQELEKERYLAAR